MNEATKLYTYRLKPTTVAYLRKIASDRGVTSADMITRWVDMRRQVDQDVAERKAQNGGAPTLNGPLQFPDGEPS